MNWLQRLIKRTAWFGHHEEEPSRRNRRILPTRQRMVVDDKPADPRATITDDNRVYRRHILDDTMNQMSLKLLYEINNTLDQAKMLDSNKANNSIVNRIIGIRDAYKAKRIDFATAASRLSEIQQLLEQVAS